MGLIGLAFGQWQRILIYGALALAVIGLIWGHGYYHGLQKLWDYQTDQAKEAVKIVVKQGEVTTRVVTKYIKVRAAAVVVEKEVEKEVIKYVERNPGHCLDPEWRGLHDAATGTIPQAAGGTDGEGGAAPTAAETLQTVTRNYAACIRTADRLDALQEWVLGQEAANRQNP